MTSSGPWLPVGHQIGSGVIGRMLRAGDVYQIFDDRNGGRILVLRPELADRLIGRGLITPEQATRIQFGSEPLHAVIGGKHDLAALGDLDSPDDFSHALSFAGALSRARELDPESNLAEAIFVERYAVLLPIPLPANPQTDDVVLGAYLTGGVPVSVHSRRRLRSLAPWLPAEALDRIVKEAGLSPTDSEGSARGQTSGHPFRLPGRPELERFLIQQVIQIVEAPERYRRLGIDFPSAFVLHGPPGCGKTFAIEKLVEYLDWSVFRVDSGSIGSPYIHETGRKISELFARAIQEKPAVVVIDEMDAFLQERDASGNQFRVEEIAEFLRRIGEAAANHVLVVGMTNRLDLIDPAILRRGRFDHIVEVGIPAVDEVRDMLESILGQRPVAEDVETHAIASEMIGLPTSDIAFVVREAARHAASAGKNRIHRDDLTAAILVTRSRRPEPPRRPVGF